MSKPTKPGLLARSIESTIAAIAPGIAASRARSRLEALRYGHAQKALQRHYQAASMGRRTGNWLSPNGSATAAAYGVLPILRARSRDLKRNSGWIRNAHRVVGTCTVGTGIEISIEGEGDKVELARSLWRKWAETTEVDAAGRTNLYGLQRRVMDAVTESGSCIVRHRPRRLEDGLTIPLQVQVLEPDFLDTTRDTMGGNASGDRIIGGVGFNQLDQRTGYWLFRSHPGDVLSPFQRLSNFVPVDRVAHVFWEERLHLVDGIPWVAPVMIRVRDFEEMEDARLLREKISSCFVGVEHDIEPMDTMVGTGGDTAVDEEGRPLPNEEEIVPGTILKAGAGRTMEFARPPTVTGFGEYSTLQLRLFAAAFGITYEALTGDYSGTNYSSSRQAWIQMRQNIEDWRWLMLVPQFLEVVWKWFVEVNAIAGNDFSGLDVSWSPPKYWMINPKEDVPATRDAIRNGLQTPSGALREAGIDPRRHFTEFARDLAELDKLGIVLDCDPRPHPYSEAGLRQPKSAAKANDTANAGADAIAKK